MISAPAKSAQHPDQALGQNTVQRRHEVVRLDAHVKEAPDHVDHVVRVDRGKYQVAGQGRLNGDLRGLFVTNFTDHDLVRIVTQNRAQPAGKGQTLFLVHRDLRDSMQLVFDRILDGDDLVFFVANFVK